MFSRAEWTTWSWLKMLGLYKLVHENIRATKSFVVYYYNIEVTYL